MNAPALEFDRVSIGYEPNARPTIDGVSLSVSPGERVALLGLNGSGKTTLLMAAVGLRPYTGEIRVCGTPVKTHTLSLIRERVGVVFNVPEDQLLFPKVVDDAAFAFLRKGMSRIESGISAKDLLAALGVGHLAESPVHHLSHGQKQRVALAGALATNPPVLLLDEPSAALDPPGKRGLARLLCGLNAAILIATHDLEFALGLCTRFVMIDSGKVVYDGNDPVAAIGRW